MKIENNILIKVTNEDINPDGSFTVPKEITEIGFAAFSKCSNLKNVIIPDNIHIIGEFAFSNCEQLKEVSIGSGITKLYFNAFDMTVDTIHLSNKINKTIEHDIISYFSATVVKS